MKEGKNNNVKRLKPAHALTVVLGDSWYTRRPLSVEWKASTDTVVFYDAAHQSVASMSYADFRIRMRQFCEIIDRWRMGVVADDVGLDEEWSYDSIAHTRYNPDLQANSKE